MLGTVERAIRLTRDFSMNIEVEAVDYLSASLAAFIAGYEDHEDRI